MMLLFVTLQLIIYIKWFKLWVPLTFIYTNYNVEINILKMGYNLCKITHKLATNILILGCKIYKR